MVNCTIQQKQKDIPRAEVQLFTMTDELKQLLYTSVLEISSSVSEEELEQSTNIIRYSTVKLSEIYKIEFRLDAEFNMETQLGSNRIQDLDNPGFKSKPLDRESGFSAFYPLRFKQLYVESHEPGVPILPSSEIISFRPQINQYISSKNITDFDDWLIKKWDILVSRYSRVGHVSIATEYFVSKALSEGTIRLRFNNVETAGYITALLRSKYGRIQLINSGYGSTISIIKIEKIKKILIPELSPICRSEIGRLMCQAGELRDEANRLLDEADRLLHERLNLPYLKDIAPSEKESFVTTVKASQLMGRLEGSFHNPVAIAAKKQLKSLSFEVTDLGDSRVTKEIRAITKFRKRTYVEKGGIPFLSSKQLFQIDPVGVKRLAKGAHTKDLPEIKLEENMIAVTRSGTIGRVQIIPKYMAEWTASEHATRFLASEDINPGYLYTWLASDYGYCLITRCSYGSVILEVDREMFSSVPIPLPEKRIRNEIGNLVLKANQLRDEAWRNEQDAITKLENLIARKQTSQIQPDTTQQLSASSELTFDPNAIPIWELVARVSARVPDEEWRKLPTDLAKRFDYYQKQRQEQD